MLLPSAHPLDVSALPLTSFKRTQRPFFLVAVFFISLVLGHPRSRSLHLNAFLTPTVRFASLFEGLSYSSSLVFGRLVEHPPTALIFYGDGGGECSLRQGYPQKFKLWVFYLNVKL